MIAILKFDSFESRDEHLDEFHSIQGFEMEFQFHEVFIGRAYAACSIPNNSALKAVKRFCKAVNVEMILCEDSWESAYLEALDQAELYEYFIVSWAIAEKKGFVHTKMNTGHEAA